MKISIIIPSLNRSYQLLSLIGNINSTSESRDITIEIIPVIDDDDLTTKGLLDKTGVHYIISPPNSTPIFKWNEGLRKSNGDWIVQGADDMSFPLDWIKSSLLTPNHGFLALPDGRVKELPYEPHYMAERNWLKKNMGGTLACPAYNHYFNDVEIGARAARLNHFSRARLIIAHSHFIWNTAKKDSTYKKSWRFMDIDKGIYEMRRDRLFPDNFNSVI